LPVVLYGCDTWSLILREECRPVTESRGAYLGSRGMRMGSEEGSTIKNFIV
jgi:hypothetical protein